MTRVLDAEGLPMYQCTFCAHQTRLSANLAKHIEARHMESGGVLCPHCDKIFNSRNSLQSHVSRKHRRTVELTGSFAA
jgi:Zinc-finger double-stranded RNA-binding